MSKEYKILIIDEDIKFIQFLEKLFIPLNYKIYSTSNPKKAIRLVEKVNADIIFIDDKTSGLSSIDLLTINKKSNPSAIRFLISDLPNIENIIEAFNNTLIYKYVPKSLTETEILDILDKALRHIEAERSKEEFYNYCKELEAEGIIDVAIPLYNHDDNTNMEILDANERRKYFRVKTFVPICSDMRILQVKGKFVDTPFTKICVIDLSGGGFRFLSELKLPISSEVVLEFQTNILDHTLLLLGHIVRMDIVETHIYEYGVEFEIDENKKSQLIRLLNEMQIDIRNNKAIRGCSFCTKENQIKCLKSRLQNDQ